MDFNNYYPYGSYNQQLNNYCFVNGIEGAKAYQLAPNQTMLLMDADRPLIFKKAADNLGKSSLRYFTLTEIDENEATKMCQPTPMPEYALKSDIEALNGKIDQLLNAFSKPEEVKQDE